MFSKSLLLLKELGQQLWTFLTSFGNEIVVKSKFFLLLVKTDIKSGKPEMYGISMKVQETRSTYVNT